MRSAWQFLMIALLLSGSVFGQEPSPSRPNVLMIIIDDMNTRLGADGPGQPRTPKIDELASHSVVFRRAYCQIPVCGASRASVFTGLRPTRERFREHRSRADQDAPEIPTLFETFRENGYTTVANGKIFHYRRDTASRSWSEPTWKPEVHNLTMLDPDSEQYKIASHGPFFERPEVEDDAYPDGKVAAKTIQDLRRLKDEEAPFFIACGFIKPHLPYYAPSRYWDLYDANQIELAGQRTRHELDPTRKDREIEGFHARGIEDRDELERTARHGYFACVSYVDALVGSVLDALEELELSESTLIVLWSDHGFTLGDHGYWGKRNLMHSSLHAPLILRAPGRATGECHALVELVDIFPTLCELAGIERPGHLEGTSMAPLLEDPKRPWKSAAFARFATSRALITQKYAYQIHGAGRRLLFDLEKDPGETTNLAKDPEYAKLVRSLNGQLAKGWKAALPTEDG